MKNNSRSYAVKSLEDYAFVFKNEAKRAFGEYRDLRRDTLFVSLEENQDPSREIVLHQHKGFLKKAFSATDKRPGDDMKRQLMQSAARRVLETARKEGRSLINGLKGDLSLLTGGKYAGQIVMRLVTLHPKNSNARFFSNQHLRRLADLRHEVGHLIVPGAHITPEPQDYPINEIKADGGMAFHLIPRFGQAGILHINEHSRWRAHGFATANERGVTNAASHLSVPVLDRILDEAERGRFHTLTPRAVVQQARNYADRYTPPPAEYARAREVFKAASLHICAHSSSPGPARDFYLRRFNQGLSSVLDSGHALSIHIALRLAEAEADILRNHAARFEAEAKKAARPDLLRRLDRALAPKR
jgi:hypothetical protein